MNVLLPHVERIGRETLNIPFGGALKEEQRRRGVAAIREVVGSGKKRMTTGLIRRVGRRLATFFRGMVPTHSPADHWDLRARDYGVRAVFNLAHGEHDLAHVTEMQKSVIHPHVRAALRHDERLALDFGCGPGRFTDDLARIIEGRAIGVDTTRAFIDMAAESEAVEYRVMIPGRIPAGDGEVDLIWICLVLGGIGDPNVLAASIRELDRVLRPGGLLVLVENTSGDERMLLIGSFVPFGSTSAS